jgi:hypothetical protein
MGGICEVRKRDKDGISGSGWSNWANEKAFIRRGILAKEKVWYGTASQKSVLLFLT